MWGRVNVFWVHTSFSWRTNWWTIIWWGLLQYCCYSCRWSQRLLICEWQGYNRPTSTCNQVGLQSQARFSSESSAKALVKEKEPMETVAHTAPLQNQWRLETMKPGVSGWNWYELIQHGLEFALGCLPHSHSCFSHADWARVSSAEVDTNNPAKEKRGRCTEFAKKYYDWWKKQTRAHPNPCDPLLIADVSAETFTEVTSSWTPFPFHRSSVSERTLSTYQWNSKRTGQWWSLSATQPFGSKSSPLSPPSILVMLLPEQSHRRFSWHASCTHPWRNQKLPRPWRASLHLLRDATCSLSWRQTLGTLGTLGTGHLGGWSNYTNLLLCWWVYIGTDR